MSRSGYFENDDASNWDFIRWSGAISSAIKGKRGQAFLRDLLDALDAMPEKRLIANNLIQSDGEVCAIGALGKRRGIDMTKIDPDDSRHVAQVFGISNALAAEIVFMNDEQFYREAPEGRWEKMRAYVSDLLKDEARPSPTSEE